MNDSLLSHFRTTPGESVRYLVRGIGHIIKFERNYDSMELRILNNKREEIQDIGNLIIKENHMEIRIDSLSKGKSYFIVQLKNNDKIIHEECIKSITAHMAVQILRLEQKLNNLIYQKN
jgi:hypothetical protein